MSRLRTLQSAWSGSSPPAIPSSRSSREATEMRSKVLNKIGGGSGQSWHAHLGRDSRARRPCHSFTQTYRFRVLTLAFFLLALSSVTTAQEAAKRQLIVPLAEG